MRRKKNVKKGIQFCLMVCGASGTGKSTPLDVNSSSGMLNCFCKDVPRLSIHCVGSECYKERTRMMRRVRILKRELGSSQ